MRSPIPALSVRPPWAAMLIHASALKPYENRCWRTDEYRGPLLIHAARTIQHGDLEFILSLHPELRGKFRFEVIGCLIGITTLEAIEDISEAKSKHLGDPTFLSGFWCWRLARPMPIFPYPCRGMRGLWYPEIDEPTLAAIRSYQTADPSNPSNRSDPSDADDSAPA